MSSVPNQCDIARRLADRAPTGGDRIVRRDPRREQCEHDEAEHDHQPDHRRTPAPQSAQGPTPWPGLRRRRDQRGGQDGRHISCSATFRSHASPAVARQSHARAGGSASARRSVLCTDCPAVLGLVGRRTTRCAHCVRYAQTGCDKSVDVARCARGPQDLCSSAPRRRAATCPGAPLQVRRWIANAHHRSWTSRQAVPGRGDLWGGEEHRAGVGARSALRGLTRRGCPSAVSAANVASCAARPQAEHRSEVGARRRPPQHEPLPGAACRDAPSQRMQTWRRQRR